MKLINEHFKYFTVYAAIVYGIGFLILSTRLASLGIFIKDFFTLDYLKAGLLFIFINLPVFFMSREIQNYELSKKQSIFFYILSILGCVFWFFLLSSFLFKHQTGYKIYSEILIFGIYPIMVYFFSLKISRVNINKLKDDGFHLGIHILLVLFVIILFSNIIFPQIQFRYGGGAPYQKTIFVKNESREIKEIEAHVYYENENWIHYIKHHKVISIPKNTIVKEESQIKDDFFIEFSE